MAPPSSKLIEKQPDFFMARGQGQNARCSASATRGSRCTFCTVCAAGIINAYLKGNETLSEISQLVMN